jgi:hypothetical protein
MRMEPADPVAGQPVSFFVELSPVEACCIAHLTFGDGSATPLAVDASCTHSSDMVRTVATHTYAAPGAYKVLLLTATVPCAPPSTDGQPWIRGANINACVVIGTSSFSSSSKAACVP